jgi:hypothetical protein
MEKAVAGMIQPTKIRNGILTGGIKILTLTYGSIF